MKWIKVLLFALCLLTPMTAVAADVPEEAVQQQLLDQFDFTKIDRMMDEIFPEEKMSFLDLVTGLIGGELEFSLELIK